MVYNPTALRRPGNDGRIGYPRFFTDFRRVGAQVGLEASVHLSTHF